MGGSGAPQAQHIGAGQSRPGAVSKPGAERDCHCTQELFGRDRGGEGSGGCPWTLLLLGASGWSSLHRRLVHVFLLQEMHVEETYIEEVRRCTWRCTLQRCTLRRGTWRCPGTCRCCEGGLQPAAAVEQPQDPCGGWEAGSWSGNVVEMIAQRLSAARADRCCSKSILLA